MPPLRVVVAGGSLAGLMTAIVLKRLGHNVTLYERVPAEMLQDRGAGMGMFNHTIQFLAKHDLTKTDAGCKSSFRQFIDRNGREIARMDMPSDKTTSWDLVHAILRANFDGLKTAQIPNPPKNDSVGCYVDGYQIERIEEGSKMLNVYLRRKGEEEETVLEADMVICADGAGGSLRRTLLGDGLGESTYAGYIAWRGTVPEPKLSSETKELVAGRVLFHHQRHNQCVGYLIPGATGNIIEGKRRMNWLWYTNVKEGGAEWQEIMTDINGVLHSHTVPHGQVRPHIWERQVKEGGEKLPPVFAELMRRTETPFIQAITDNLSPRATFFDGRVILVGDSVAGFRPHTAASTAQAAYHALLLEKLILESDGVMGQSQVKEYEDEVLRHAKDVSEKGIQMGDSSQFGAHPMQRTSGEI